MALNQDIAVLQSIPLFKAFDREALRLIAFSAESRIMRAGDILFRRDEVSDGGYVVMTGAIAFDAADDGGPSPTVATSGALIGELALIVETRRPATAIVREPSSLMKITRPVFRRVLEEFPASLQIISRMIEERLRTTSQDISAVRHRLMAIDRENPLPPERNGPEQG